MSNSLKSSQSSNLQVKTSSWNAIWLKALLQPYVATYEAFIRDPEASSKRAYIWVFTSVLLACFIIGFNPFVRPETLPLGKNLVAILVLPFGMIIWFIFLTGS